MKRTIEEEVDLLVKFYSRDGNEEQLKAAVNGIIEKSSNGNRMDKTSQESKGLGMVSRSQLCSPSCPLASYGESLGKEMAGCNNSAGFTGDFMG